MNHKTMLEYRLNKALLISILLICCMPIIFYLLDGKWYPSISSMVDSPNHAVFYLFIFSGFFAILVYGLKDDFTVLGKYQTRNKWFELITAFSLLGVGLFHYKEHSILHYISAGLFFVSIFTNIIVFSSRKQRPFKIVIVSIIPISLCLVLFKCISLTAAEEIGVLIYAVSIYLETKKIID